MRHLNETHADPLPLQKAVDLVYKVFDQEKAPAGHLDVCTSCCMPPELEKEMRHLPLCKLTADHFYEYGGGAFLNSVQPPEETRYFMPRLFELLAEGAVLRMAHEITLDRVGRCPKDGFTRVQREAMDAFMLSYFAATLVETRSSEEAPGWCDEPLTNLLMAHIGGFELQPLLDHWLRCEDPRATLRYVSEVYWNFAWRGEIDNLFAKDAPDFKAQMKQWLTEPTHRLIFAQRLLAPEFQALALVQESKKATPFQTIVDAVFEQLIL